MRGSYDRLDPSVQPDADRTVVMPEVRNTHHAKASISWVKVSIAIVEGMVIAAAGLFCLIFPPLGLALLVMSGMPLARVINNYNKAQDNDPLEQGSKPWE